MSDACHHDRRAFKVIKRSYNFHTPTYDLASGLRAVRLNLTAGCLSPLIVKIAQSRAAELEMEEKMDTVLWIDAMTLSFPPDSSDDGIWSCRREIIESMEWQFWSRKVSGCSTNIMHVF